MAQHLFTSITYYNNIIPIILYGGYIQNRIRITALPRSILYEPYYIHIPNIILYKC